MIDLTEISEWANGPNLSILEKPIDITQFKVQLAIAEQLKRIADALAKGSISPDERRARFLQECAAKGINPND